MRTARVSVDPEKSPWPGLDELAGVLEDGGIVAIPTETVYGLAVNLRDEAAVRRLAQVRGRAAEGPATLHLADPDDLLREVRSLPLAARKLVTRFWPGPLTIVVADRHGRPTGYRVPDVGVTRALLRATPVRVGAVAAAPAGGRSSVTADDVAAHFDGVIDAILDAGPARHGAPSSIVRVFPGGEVEVLHEGVVPAAEIRETTAHTILFVCSGNRCRSPLAAAMATRMLARREGVDELELLAAGYRIESAGTGCLRGAPATPEAQAAAAARGLDLSTHEAQPLTHAVLERADEIFVMTRAHRDSIAEFAPDAVARVRPLDRRARDIPDPYGHGQQAYEKIADILQDALRSRLDDL